MNSLIKESQRKEIKKIILLKFSKEIKTLFIYPRNLFIYHISFNKSVNENICGFQRARMLERERKRKRESETEIEREKMHSK